MAEILPFRAWRYHKDLIPEMERLTSPLFDVVSSVQKEKLYRNPFNSIHLSVPHGNNPAIRAKMTLENWKNREIIRQDYLPGIYVYYQYFKLPESEEEYCRKGFIALVQTYDWDEKVIQRHENTIPVSVNDRLEILKETNFQSSMTHGLYENPDFYLEKYMDNAIKDPVYDIEDYQGIREVVSMIHDAKIIREFVRFMQDKNIILADGHHRYQASLSYRKLKKMENPEHTGKEGYNFHLMYFTNSLAKGLKILPTHRMFKQIKKTKQELLDKISRYFTIKELEDPYEIGEQNLCQPHTFGLLFGDTAFKITLNPEVLSNLNFPVPDIIQKQDVWILHYFIIEKVLGIAMEEQNRSSHIIYEKNISRCHQMLLQKEVDLAVITRGVAINDILEIVKSGFTMPQKSTYFYPKTISGLVYASISDEEFQYPAALIE